MQPPSQKAPPGAFSWFVAKVLSGNTMVPLVELLALMLCGIDVLYGSESLTPFSGCKRVRLVLCRVQLLIRRLAAL